MKRVLLAWEIGSGLGNVHLLAAIAHELITYGIEPIFVLQRGAIGGLELPGKVLQAPTARIKIFNHQGNTEPYLFTDLLYVFGFSTPLALDEHITAWQNLIKLIKPSLIIANSAPALVLAAKGKIPTIVVGKGFGVAPVVDELPPQTKQVRSPAMVRQTEVIETIRTVTGSNEPLDDLLNGDRSFIFSIPELDPYRDARTAAEYVGVHSAPFPENLGDERGEACSYLDSDWSDYSFVVDTFKAQCVADDLKIALKGKSLAIHHANLATSVACLIAGIPQLVFPTDVEKQHTAKALEDLGVAIVAKEPSSEYLSECLEYLPEVRQNAQEAKKRFATWNQNFLEKVVQACLEYIS